MGFTFVIAKAAFSGPVFCLCESVSAFDLGFLKLAFTWCLFPPNFLAGSEPPCLISAAGWPRSLFPHSAPILSRITVDGSLGIQSMRRFPAMLVTCQLEAGSFTPEDDDDSVMHGQTCCRQRRVMQLPVQSLLVKLLFHIHMAVVIVNWICHLSGFSDTKRLEKI